MQWALINGIVNDNIDYLNGNCNINSVYEKYRDSLSLFIICLQLTDHK